MCHPWDNFRLTLDIQTSNFYLLIQAEKRNREIFIGLKKLLRFFLYRRRKFWKKNRNLDNHINKNTTQASWWIPKKTQRKENDRTWQVVPAFQIDTLPIGWNRDQTPKPQTWCSNPARLARYRDDAAEFATSAERRRCGNSSSRKCPIGSVSRIPFTSRKNRKTFFWQINRSYCFRWELNHALRRPLAVLWFLLGGIYWLLVSMHYLRFLS